jgi:general secretion pathway protein H
MAKKAEAVQQPTSVATSDNARYLEAGFTILEMVCVIAIIAILASLALPRLPHATSRVRLESYAFETAALLKADRTAAIRRHHQIATVVDAKARWVRSGATGRSVQLPADITLDALLAAHCGGYPANSRIAFFPTGMSCGGAITLRRPGNGYEIRVNWLTGGIEIVPLRRA